MPDYGHELEFGYFILPAADDPQAALRTADLVEELDYDRIGIQDHPYLAWQVDTYALVATILARTEHVRVFPMVTNMHARSPSLVANFIATLDRLSNGRVDLGLGAGTGPFHDQAVAFGAEPRSPSHAVEALSESIDVIRALWSGEENLQFNGEHYRLSGGQGGPVPTRKPEISIGALKPRMLKLVGQKADAWVGPSTGYALPGVAAENSLAIDQAAIEAGRQPAEIRRIYNVPGQFVDVAPSPPSDSDKEIVGPVDHWVQVLVHQAVDFGFSTFVLYGPPEPYRLETFIREVAPRVREAVAQRREHSA